MNSSIDNRLKLLEIVTNKLNPRYKKDIMPLNELDIPQELIEKAKKYSINLRGLEEKEISFIENNLEIIKPDLNKDNMTFAHWIPESNLLLSNNRVIIFEINKELIIKQYFKIQIPQLEYYNNTIRKIEIIDDIIIILIGDYNIEFFKLESNKIHHINTYIERYGQNLTFIQVLKKLQNNFIVFGGEGCRLNIYDVKKMKIYTFKLGEWINSIVFLNENRLLINNKIIINLINENNDIYFDILKNVDNFNKYHTLFALNSKNILCYNDKKIYIIDNETFNKKSNININIKDVIKIDKNIILGYDNIKLVFLNINNKNSLEILHSIEFDFLIEKIIKISDNIINIVTKNGEMSFLHIKDIKNSKIISKILLLENGTFEIENERKLCFINPNGWHINNDPLLYKYARLYDSKTKELVPYYMLEKRLKVSEDKKEVCIKRLKK